MDKASCVNPPLLDFPIQLCYTWQAVPTYTHHATKTTQESTNSDKQTPGGPRCSAAFTVFLRIYIILKFWIFYVYLLLLLKCGAKWKAKQKWRDCLFTFQCKFEKEIRSKVCSLCWNRKPLCKSVPESSFTHTWAGEKQSTVYVHVSRLI